MSAYSGSARLQRGAVQTRAELEALIRTRGEFTDQLERVTQQRGELAQQRLNAEARAQSSTDPSLDRRLMREYEQQIGELGARAGQLRAQIAQADEAIANAVAQGIGEATAGEPVQTSVISIPGGEDFSAREALLRDRYQSMMIAEGAALILLSVMAWRLLWRRAQRKAATMYASNADVTSMKVAIDTIAVEVERISENQRYATKLLQERAEPIGGLESAAKVPVEQRRQQG